MTAYPVCYVDEIVETQGRLFEQVADMQPALDVEDFITRYMQSRTRRFLDGADAYVSNLDGSELYAYFCAVDKFLPRSGSSLGGFFPNWVGQFYAYCQWFYNIKSALLIERLPLHFMKAAYGGLHDVDIALAVKKLGAAVAL